MTKGHLACGQVDRVLDGRSEGMGFNSQCWLCRTGKSVG